MFCGVDISQCQNWRAENINRKPHWKVKKVITEIKIHANPGLA